MTFVGKLLIVLQVFLSLCFMAFAGAVYTTQTNWKTKADAAAAQVATLQTTLEAVNGEFASHKQNADAAVKAADAKAARFEADFNQASQELAAATNQLNDTITERNAAIEESRIASEEAQQRLREVTEMRSELAKLRVKGDEQTTTIRTMEDQILDLEGKLADAFLKNEKLNEDLAVKIELLLEEGLDPDARPSGDQLPPPPKGLRGFVLDSRRNKSGSTELVHVSNGADDGLEIGHELIVYRGGKYLGVIQLISVDADDSIGVVKNRARSGVIERGDNVTTSLEL